VLIIAHEFSPMQGSECAEGWNIVTRLASYHNVTVLYASGSQANPNGYVNAINDFIKKQGPVEGLTFINIDQPKSTKMIASGNKAFSKLGAIGLPVLYYLGYKYWQKAAFKKAKQLHQEEKFDVIHQLTQIAFREPGLWWKLGIPFFWGPTGGVTTLPKKFYELLSGKNKMLERIRTFSNFYQFNYSSRVIKANKLASVIYAFSKEDAQLFKKRATGEIKLMLDAGSANHSFPDMERKTSSTVLKGIWCGQLIERKAAIILLKALALSEATKKQVQFQIVGGGSLEKMLHEEAARLGLDNIEWIKNVSRETVFHLMSNADFCVHTSIREATSNVIPEALSCGLPVICHDVNGMSIAINDTCGIKIPFISPAESIEGFHKAITTLVQNKNYLDQLKSGAAIRSQEISWVKMAETIATDYSEIVNRGSKKNLNKEHLASHESIAN
jgi:glycosyltransferase involved in cell wall biosynthesis